MPKLANIARRIAEFVELRDVFAFAGLGMVCYGMSQVYPPSAWIIGGSMFFWLGARR